MERSDALRSAAYAAWAAHAPAQEYLARIHVDAADGLHGALSGGGGEAKAERAFLRAFHELAFEAALPADAAGTSRDLTGIWRDARLAHLTTYPETLEVLRSLRAELPFALVTNGPSSLQRLKVRRTGLAGYFPVVVAAEDIGIGKPGPQIFDAALRGLGLDGGEVVMVGNDLGRDAAGARAAGIDAIWVDRGPRDSALPNLARESAPADSPRADPEAGGIADLRGLPGRL